MPERIVIERVEFLGHCGVTKEERTAAQPIGVDLELVYAPEAFAAAARTDSLDLAVDYAAVVRRIAEVGQARESHLLESLAEGLAATVLAEFPVLSVGLWVRKLRPPLERVSGSVGVRLERTRPVQGPPGSPGPAPFLSQCLARLRKGRALDVAAGRGRNALLLAAQGFAVDAVDRDEAALRGLAEVAGTRGLANLTVRVLDLEADPLSPPDLGTQRYDVVTVFFYLHRPVFPALLRALKPGGALLYETFLLENHERYGHPRRREFCLAHNELLALTHGLRVLHYDEGLHEDRTGDGGEPIRAFTARLLAVREA